MIYSANTYDIIQLTIPTYSATQYYNIILKIYLPIDSYRSNHQSHLY